MKSPVFLHIFLVILQNSFHEYQIFANSIRSYSCTLLLPFLTRLRICCTYLIKTFVTFPRYILRKLYRLYQKNVAVCIELVHDWLAGTKKWKFECMEIFNFESFATLFYLVPRLIICFFLMTESALNLALKLVVLSCRARKSET